MRYWIMAVAFFLSLGACAQDAPVSGERFIEGQHYMKMQAPVPTIVGEDKVEITEVFRFGCPACFHFESAISEWKKSKPAAAELVKNPVVWNKDTAIRAQVYYTGVELGKGPETVDAIFKAMHVDATNARDAKTALLDEDDILDMFVSLGVDREKASKMYNNWFIKSKVNQADGRARAFAISGTPEIFVDGRYRITTGSAGDFETMLEVASFLVEKIAAERGLN